MSDQIWIAIIAGLPATIAAISSLKNGSEQRRVREELAQVNGKVSSAPRKSRKKQAGGADGNTASNPDWYQPPDL